MKNNTTNSKNKNKLILKKRSIVSDHSQPDNVHNPTIIIFTFISN
jgi:hypothetical protein